MHAADVTGILAYELYKWAKKTYIIFWWLRRKESTY